MSGEAPRVYPNDGVKFGARRTIPVYDLAPAGVEFTTEELADLVARISEGLVYTVVKEHGLHDMTITIKKQPEDRANFKVESWVFELHGKKPS